MIAPVIRRVARLTVSCAVGAGDRLVDICASAAGLSRPARAVVLYYHAVKAAERARFAAQMDALAHLCRPIRADADGPLGAGTRYAAVTFDDGFVSVIENALPELERRSIPCTLFVPSGSWGSRPAWVRNPAARAYGEVVLSQLQLEQVGRHPLVTIGSHAISHRSFLTLGTAEASRELEESKSALEQVVGHEVTLFSFPHGEHDGSLVDLARQAGYRRVFSVEPGWAFRQAGESVVGRVAVEPTDWAIEFRLKILGAYRWGRLLRRRPS